MKPTVINGAKVKQTNRHKIILTFGLLVIFSASFFIDGFKLKSSLFEDLDLKSRKAYSAQAQIEDDLKNGSNHFVECEIVIAGGGNGGTAAAIQAGRMGIKTCLIEETDWLGGMLSAAGVSGIDGMKETPAGIFKEFISNLKKYYKKIGKIDEITKCTVSYLCFEPEIGDLVLKDMVKKETNVNLYYNSKVLAVYREKNKILGVKFIDSKNHQLFIAPAKVTVDATEFGDLMYMANIPFDLGTDAETSEIHANDISQCIQPLTYVTILHKQNKNAPAITKPKDYNRQNYACSVPNSYCENTNSKFNLVRLLNYGYLPGNNLMINIPSHSYGNDFDATNPRYDDLSRAEILQKAKDYTLGFVYFMQMDLGLHDYTLTDKFGTNDQLAQIPYVRESRRLRGALRLQESDVLPSQDKRPRIFKDSIAVGDYPIDLHYCSNGIGDLYYSISPYQIPYGVTVPAEVDGFLAAEKNISVSHIVNGTTRLQPIVMAVGQAVGAAAAIAVKDNVEPRNVDIVKLQNILLDAGSRIFYFKDLPMDHFSTILTSKLALNGLISGFSDLSVRPNEPITRQILLGLIKKFFQVEDKINPEDIQQYFLPMDDLISREEFAVILDKIILNLLPDNYKKNLDLAKNSSLKNKKNSFKDVNKSSKYFEAINKLTTLGLVNTENSNYRPKELLTRAEAITILGRLMQQK